MLMSVGYFMGRLGWMTAAEKRFLSKFIVNIAVPCNCVTGLLNNLDHDSLLQAGVMGGLAMVGVAVTLALCLLLAKLLRLPRERWGVFVAMAAFSNTLFIGLPVSTQLFGDVCVPYVMMYYLANTLFVQSAGILLIERSGTRAGKKTTVGGFFKDVFTKPPILAVLFTVLLLVLDLRLPGPIMTWAGYISQSVSPMALIYCGYIVFELGLKNLRPMKGPARHDPHAAGNRPGDLLVLLPPVRHERPAPQRLCGGERPAGGEPGARAGGGLWGGRPVRQPPGRSCPPCAAL